MRHYLFVGDREAQEVLGVWEVEDQHSASRLQMTLGLRYPGCATVHSRIDDFESLKQEHKHYDFGGLLPERVRQTR